MVRLANGKRLEDEKKKKTLLLWLLFSSARLEITPALALGPELTGD